MGDEAAARAWVRSLPQGDAVAMARLDRLIGLLSAENRRQNLVAHPSLAQIWRRHIADSAQLLAHVPRGTARNGVWLDLGTGAGFPGLVIAILLPDRPVMMIESRRRRIVWLESVCADLGLAAARVIGRPLESVPDMAAAVISARAFAPLDRLIALSARFSTKDTLWLLPKGRQAGDEVAALSGWRHDLRVEPSLTDAGSGIILGHVHGPMQHRSNGDTA